MTVASSTHEPPAARPSLPSVALPVEHRGWGPDVDLAPATLAISAFGLDRPLWAGAVAIASVIALHRLLAPGQFLDQSSSAYVRWP